MSAIGLFLKAYWRELAAIALLAYACWRGYGFAYDNGQRDCQNATLTEQNKGLVAAVAERDKAIADRNEAQRKADKLAVHPPKVVKVVRQNPSGCSLAKPVADELRKQVAATNDAIPATPVP